MIASSLVIFSASFALAKWMTANAPAPSLFIEEALLGATLLWTRRCVPPRLRTLKDHSADLRFDMEGEEDTNSNSALYGFLTKSASNPQEGQTQNSDSVD